MKTNSQNKKWCYLSLGISGIIIILEIIGGIMSTKMLPIEQFMFYTQNSNYFLLLSTLIWVVYLVRYLRSGIQVPHFVFLLKYMATCMVALTFIVAMLVLGPMFGNIPFLMFGGIALYFHTLCPILAILDFLLFERGQQWQMKHVWLAMVPTTAYAVLAIVLNLCRIWHGPYPFLYVYENPVWVSCIWAVVIPGAALLLATILRLGNHYFSKKDIK